MAKPARSSGGPVCDIGAFELLPLGTPALGLYGLLLAVAVLLAVRAVTRRRSVATAIEA